MEGPETPMPQGRFALFDSLRAIAALSVVTFHGAVASRAAFESPLGALTNSLNVGVTLFFLLSGFLLYRPHALALFGHAGTPALGHYAKRRFLRIAPAYWVALTVLALWPGLKGVLTHDWWVYYGLLQSYRLQWFWGGIGPASTLSVEVAFYALLPLLASAIAHGASTGRVHLRALVPLCLLGAFGLAFRIVSLSIGSVGLMAALPAYLLWFVAGMVLALVSARLGHDGAGSRLAQWVRRHPTPCWLLALGLYLALATTSPAPLAQLTVARDVVQHVGYGLIAALVVAPAIFGEDAGGLPRRILGSRTLTRIGLWSYGIFLWHHPLMGVLARLELPFGPLGRFLSLTGASMAVAIACGWLSYRFVEQPALRLTRRPAPIPVATAPGTPNGAGVR